MEVETNRQVVRVSIEKQSLQLLESGGVVFQAPISSGLKGVGEQYGSERTPRGWHVIRAKIGDDCPENTVFVARRPTGEIYHPDMKIKEPARDWILTRILWLSGIEPGFNRLGGVDTMRRFIYIHGCPDEDILGIPGSHGCIKMKNADVISLFDLVLPGTHVLIEG